MHIEHVAEVQHVQHMQHNPEQVGVEEGVVRGFVLVWRGGESACCYGSRGSHLRAQEAVQRWCHATPAGRRPMPGGSTLAAG